MSPFWLRCMGASNQKSFSWFKSVSGRCSSLDHSLSSATQNVVFVSRPQNLKVWGLMRAFDFAPALDMHSFLVSSGEGWSILTYGHSLYTTVNNIGWQSSGSFFLGLAIAWWLTLWTLTSILPPLLLVLHPLSFHHTLYPTPVFQYSQPWHVKLQGCPLAVISLFI